MATLRYASEDNLGLAGVGELEPVVPYRDLNADSESAKER